MPFALVALRPPFYWIIGLKVALSPPPGKLGAQEEEAGTF